MWDRKKLKEKGKNALTRNYWKAVLVSAVFAGVIAGGGASGSTALDNVQADMNMSSYSNAILFAGAAFAICAVATYILFYVLLINPFEVGVSKIRLNALNGRGNVSDMGNGYDVSYKRNVKTLLLRDVFTVLWMMLFIVPGIIKIYEYRMIPYLLADNPKMSNEEVFQKSKEMMRGNKWKAFVLDISFILWDILGTLTLGIVTVLYVDPYRQLTHAALYEELKSNR